MSLLQRSRNYWRVHLIFLFLLPCLELLAVSLVGQYLPELCSGSAQQPHLLTWLWTLPVSALVTLGGAMCRTEDVVPSAYVLAPASTEMKSHYDLGLTKLTNTDRNQDNIFLLFYCFQSLLPTLLPKLGQLGSSMTCQLELLKELVMY